MLVLRPGALGDTLLAVPALRALRRAGHAPIRLAAHGRAARLLVRLGEIDAGMAFDDPALSWLFGASEAEEPVVAWLNPSGFPALERALVCAPGRPAAVQHCAEYLVSTLGPLGVPPFVDESPLSVPQIRSDEILIHVGSGSESKNWPPDRYAETIRLLERPLRLVVGEADVVSAARVDECLGYELPRLECPTLDELAGRLAGCRAYLGNDSGVSHLAGLCGAHSIVLFGPTSPDIWRPLGPNVHVESFGVDPRRVVALLRG